MRLSEKTTSLQQLVEEFDGSVRRGDPLSGSREAFLLAAREGDLPAVPRMWCLFVAAELAPPDLEELFLRTMRDPVWEDWGLRDVRRPAETVWRSVRSPGLRLAIARDRSVPDEAARILVGAMSPAMDAETIEAVLARWLDAPEPLGVVSHALASMGDHPDVADRALLEREALGERYPRAAVAAIGRLREPALYPLLARCLDPRWLPAGTVREGVRSAALEGLVGTFDDQAAGLLLDELERTDDEEFRAVLIRGLQTMRTYREEREVWRRRIELADMRRATVEALLVLAAPASDGKAEQPVGVRADALRALGSLGATEAMPLILDALQSSSADLREAAREALDALYREPQRALPRSGSDASGGPGGLSGSGQDG